jgi:hypothetical protein
MADVLMLAVAFAPLLAKPVAGLWARHGLSRYVPLKVTTRISTVAGPDFPLYCAGAKLVNYYGLGVLTPGMGIFHLMFSYTRKVTLSVLADRDIMPDPAFYHDCLVASFDEIYGAARALQAPRGHSDTAATPGIVSPKRRTDKAKPGPKTKRIKQ